jgi:hypothetical protein
MYRSQKLFFAGLLLAIAFIMSAPALAQEGSPPSPGASIGQVIGGETEIAITYSRPGVKGREIWGELVPYDKAWRAGANNPTTVTFSTDVTLNGKSVEAGSYTLLITPQAKGNWTLHFIDPGDEENPEEVLKLSVKAEDAPHKERLVYGFDELSPDDGPTTASAYMHWEKKKVSFKIELDD